MAEISPYLLYEDGVRAIDFLRDAFGFRETLRFDAPDGGVNHAEMQLDGATIMLGTPGGDFQSPKRTGYRNQLVHVYVDDVDAHFERARAAGATIFEQLAEQDYGDRRYAAEDSEGHHWYFAQRAREAAPV